MDIRNRLAKTLRSEISHTYYKTRSYSTMFIKRTNKLKNVWKKQCKMLMYLTNNQVSLYNAKYNN